MDKEARFGFENDLTVLQCSKCLGTIKTSLFFTDEEIECCQGMVTLEPQFCKKCMIKDGQIIITFETTSDEKCVYHLFHSIDEKNPIGYVILSKDHLEGLDQGDKQKWLILNYDKIIWSI